MKHTRYRSTGLAITLAAAVTLSTVACGGSDDNGKDTDGGGTVTLTVNGLPPATDTVNRKNFEDDVVAFQAKHPNIKIDAKEGLMDPQTFSAKLAGGQLEDVFYVYFTDPANLITKHQVADISKYLGDFPTIKDVKPELMRVFQDSAGKTYGLPQHNYSLGLVYNRDLFTRAGLNPHNPPTTWEQVRESAKKITALGDGISGYGDYSKSNTGGWHFTAELYSVGGDVAVNNGGTWKAAFNSAQGKQVLQQLKDMRWADNSMGAKQMLEYADLLTMMAAGKLGMYVGGADNLPSIVNQYKGSYANLGLGSIPGGKATLGGGDGFMFKAGLSAAKIKAGMQWLTFKMLDPERIGPDNQKAAASGAPVGLPEPNIWTGASAQKQADATKQYANVPTANFQAFVTGSATIKLKLEPPNAQQVYAVLDTVMQKVLTDRDANVDALLKDAEGQVNTILAGVK